MSAILKRANSFFPLGDFFDRRLDVQITSINDKGRVVQDLKPVHYNQNKDVAYAKSKMQGGSPYPGKIQEYQSRVPDIPLFGQPDKTFSFDKDNAIVKISRRFIAKGLRCITKALEFKPALSLVAKSDDYSLAIFNGSTAASLIGFIWSKIQYTGNVITLKNVIGVVPSVDHSVEGYMLSFEYDNYTALYPITNVSGSGDTAVLGVPFLNYSGVITPAGTYKWKLYSFPKNQFFGICNYSISYSEALDSDSLYRISGNAGDKAEP